MRNEYPWMVRIPLSGMMKWVEKSKFCHSIFGLSVSQITFVFLVYSIPPKMPESHAFLDF